MRRKKRLFGALIIIALLVLLMLPCKINATELYAASEPDTNSRVEPGLENIEGMLEEEFDASGINDVELEEEIGDYGRLGFGELVKKIISGEFDLSFKSAWNGFKKTALGELQNQGSLMQKILIIALLCAILKSISGSFGQSGVEELGFYICYIVLIVLIIASFAGAMKLVVSTTERVVYAMQALLPIFVSFTFAGSHPGIGMTYYPVIIGAAELIAVFIKDVLLPVLSVTTALHLINYISEREYLSQFASILKKLINIGLKTAATIFMAVLSLQRIGAPVLNQVLSKGAKAALEAVPVVGDVMAGAVEVGATLTKAIGSGAGAAAIIFLVVIALMPILKLVIMVFIFKISAALSEPLGNSRIVKALSGAGDFTMLLVGMLFTVEVMFIFSIIILLSSL